MTRVVVVSTEDRVYGVNKSLELLDINPVKGKNVIFKPNFNTADPPPASSSMETVRQLIMTPISLALAICCFIVLLQF